MATTLKERLVTLGFDLPPTIVEQLERFAAELLRWNQRRNLTSITERNDVLEKHLLDSLTVLPFARSASRLLDLGSGAGFPALPLKIACPTVEVVAVDAVGKKIDFQRHAVRTLGLKGYTAVHGRAESLSEHPACRDGFDLVTARALSSLVQVVRLAKPFLAPGGRLVAMKGPDGRQELEEVRDYLLNDGWSVELHSLTLPDSGAARCLIELTRTKIQ